MGEVVRFISRSELERMRSIREARAIYDSIFPSTDPISEQRNSASGIHRAGGANANLSDWDFS